MKKKIALLQLRLDNNYGGNLQRYALITILKQMGYDVTYIYMRKEWSNKGWRFWIKQTLKQFIKHYLLGRRNELVCLWKREADEYIKRCDLVEPFLKKYIPHSPIIYGSLWFNTYIKWKQFDAYIVGSDQVWRKPYIHHYGLGMWFMGFLPDNYKGKRIAYGASFGVSEEEYSKEEQDFIRPLFNRFDAVSVREISGLDLLQQYRWTNPKATCVLDPTLLLKAEDYLKLIENAHTLPLDGKLLCYILDMDIEKEQFIQQKSKESDLKPTIHYGEFKATETIEQWLRNYYEAEYIVTDSYHGVIFALIFNKPFTVFMNPKRGNSRFKSLEKVLGIRLNDSIDYKKLNATIEKERLKSMEFLINALE